MLLAECQDQGRLGQEGDITKCNSLTDTEAEPQPGLRGQAAGPGSYSVLAADVDLQDNYLGVFISKRSVPCVLSRRRQGNS